MIVGKTVTLLPFDRKHVDLARSWVNQADVRSGTGMEGPVSELEHQNWYEQLMADRSHRLFIIAQGQGEAAAPIGVVGLKNIKHRSRSAEFWIYIGNSEARRQGLASEASQLMLEFAFNMLNLHTVYLAVLATNDGALALYRKLGFVHEGTGRERAFSDGRFVDLLSFSMTEDEFRNRYGPAAADSSRRTI